MGVRNRKKSLDQGKRKLERNFEKCATNLVKMNYRVALVFSYERFENALFCINSIGHSTRLRSIFNFPIFRKNGASPGTFEYCFLKMVYLKGFLVKKKNPNFLIRRGVLDSYRQRLLSYRTNKP